MAIPWALIAVICEIEHPENCAWWMKVGIPTREACVAEVHRARFEIDAATGERVPSRWAIKPGTGRCVETSINIEKLRSR